MLYRFRPLFQIKEMPNWKALDEKMTDPEIRLQHLSTSTKLYVAKRHVNKLKEIIPTQRATDLLKIEFIGATVKTEIPISMIPKDQDFFDEIEVVFLYLRSCIDSFLWEINMGFRLSCSKINLSRRGEFLQKLNKRYKDKELTWLLNNLNQENWFKYLNDMRNQISHRLLYDIATFEDFRLYLPCDPKANSYERKTEYELIPCLDKQIENVRDFLEKGYCLLLDEEI